MYERDLLRVKDELNAYADEEAIWKSHEGINNSAGNLVTHICGCIQHFIGAVLGNTGYQRQRDLEFSIKNVSREDLLVEIDTTIRIVNETLDFIPEEILNGDYPILFREKTIGTRPMLIHLYGHLSYHLGQINYYRRMNNCKEDI